MRFDDTVNFPWNMAVAATGNPEYARRQGEITAREARALGVQQIFAPVVDVNNNAANPVINVRSYGEDPADVARFAAAFTEGAQAAGVIATAKHFPGHGDTAVDSHRGLPEINVGRERLNTVEFVPFQATVKAGVGAVMVGHIALPQIDATATMPATMSPVMGRILRNDLKFSGMIVTDALSMSGLTIYFTQEEAAVRALEAGADMLLKPADVDASFRGVRDAVKSGRITEQRVEESARRILAAKYDLGLVDQRLTPVDTIDHVVGSRDVVALATDIAEHAITLGRRSPLERVAHFLLELLARLQAVGLANERSFCLPLTQELIADALGLSIPYVNQVLRSLRDDDLVCIKDKVVVIKDVEALSALVDFERNYLKPLSIVDLLNEAA